MASQFNLITEIPSILAIDCLSNCLSLRDVCFLDSACCCRNSKDREVLLALLDSEEFILDQKTNIDNVDMTKWLCKRRIRVSSIHIQTASDGAEVSKYLALFGMHVRIVHFKPYMDSARCKIIVSALTTYCHHLTAITCMRGYKFPSQKDYFENLLLNNPDLELLELDRVTLDAIALQGIALPKLRHLKWRYSYLNSTLCEVFSVSVAPQVDRLDLSYSHCDQKDQLWLWRSFRNLRALQLVNCHFMSDLQLQNIALNCPFLVHLCLIDCTGITDVGMQAIAMNLAQLRSLDIRGCDDLTDQTMHYLTQHCAVHLHAIYFDVRNFSSLAISELFKHSRNLCEVGICVITKDNFPVKEWDTIFKAAPAISVLVLDLENLSDVPLDLFAQHCRQLRRLNFATVNGEHITFNEQQRLLSMLGECPNLHELNIPPDLYNPLVDIIMFMYPHLQVVTSTDYPYFDALAQPI